jgi:ATP-dependent RNA helicase MSS116
MRELARVSQRAKGGLILIGTPGRLNDLLENRSSILFLLSLDRSARQTLTYLPCTTGTDGLQNQMPNLSHLVLDEGDTLLDGGFERELKRIISFLPPRYTALFSATVPQRVLKVASTALRPGYQMISTVEEGEGMFVNPFAGLLLVYMVSASSLSRPTC